VNSRNVVHIVALPFTSAPVCKEGPVFRTRHELERVSFPCSRLQRKAAALDDIAKSPDPLVPLTRYGIPGALQCLRHSRSPSIACASLGLPNRVRPGVDEWRHARRAESLEGTTAGRGSPTAPPCGLGLKLPVSNSPENRPLCANRLVPNRNAVMACTVGPWQLHQLEFVGQGRGDSVI
jgi:hypothetical protein